MARSIVICARKRGDIYMTRSIVKCTCKKCGAEFDKVVYGANRRDADSKAEWAEGFFDLCPGCYQIEKEIKNQKTLEEKEQAMKLSELEGTEKQIAWARKIRIGYMEALFEMIEEEALEIEDGDCDSVVLERYELWKNSYDYLLTVTDSKFWINSNSMWLDELVEKVSPEVMKSTEQKEYEEEEKEISKIRKRLAAPEEIKHEEIVSIEIKDSIVYARNERCEWLQDFYHKRLYEWNKKAKAFRHETELFKGTAEDHAAELGNLLLNEGFRVEFPSAEIMRKAVEGDYEPENFRWVYKRPYDNDHVWIKWGNRYNFFDTEEYYACSSLPGAERDCPTFRVPCKAYREIEDFARINGFDISQGARENLDRYKTMETVRVAKPKKVSAGVDPRSMRNTSDDILAKLRDED